MIVKKMKPNDAIQAMSNLLVEEHIFRNLDEELKTPYGIHKLFSKIERGTIDVYGAFKDIDETCELYGVVWGYEDADEPGAFVNHVMFRRHVPSASEALLLTEREIKKDYAFMEFMTCYIPIFNRTAIRLAKRAGGEDCGIRDDKVFFRDGVEYSCRELRKAI